MHDAEVELLQLAGLDLFIEHPQGGRVFGRDDDAARIAVDPVAEGGRKAVLPGGVVLALLVEVVEDAVDQRVRLAALVLVDEQAGALVREEDVFILVEDVDRGRDGEEGGRAGRAAEKLVVQVEGKPVSLAQTGGDLAPLAVELDPLGADGFIEQGLGQQRDRLGHELVHALARVVLIDDEFPHGEPPQPRWSKGPVNQWPRGVETARGGGDRM